MDIQSKKELSLNKKNILIEKNKIIIFQDSLAIRSWKLGYSLNSLGYEVSYAYENYDFNFSYVDLDVGFVKGYYKTKTYNHLKCVLHKFDYIIYINGWREICSSLADDGINSIGYIGDLQILRHQFIKNGLENISVKREKSIFLSDHKLIFTNQYMVEKLINEHKLKFKKPHEIITNSHLKCEKNYKTLEKNENILLKDYRDKDFFRLVYIGSICDQKSHRNLISIFKKIVSPNVELTIYGTKHNQETMKGYFKDNPYIHFKSTIPHNKIIEELSQYDYGLCFFNMDHSDSEYIEISQPNKFYDYFYARIPVICNNTHAFSDFVNKNKVGFCISNPEDINSENMKKIFSFQDAKIATYNEMVKEKESSILSPNNSINKEYYKFVFVSKALKFFKKMTEKKYNLDEYSPLVHLHEPTLFFGLYNKEDVDYLISHKGPKKLLLGGSDARYKPLEENIDILQKHNIEIICQSKYLFDRLREIGYPDFLSNLNPFTPAQVHDFYDPETTKGKSIYIYTASKSPEIYGDDIYNQVIEKLKDQFNFIVCEARTTDDIKSIYKECFIGLRLTRFDGLGCTNIELGLMGIKSVSNNLSPNCLPWETVDDVVEHILRESKNIGMKDKKLADQTLSFISKEYDILKLAKKKHSKSSFFSRLKSWIQ